MEEEQKVDLPLNGELDIKSSDMLVSVNDAKLAHNRQRWQGHCLPSSLRYEHDGWAAGWDVYNLNYNEVTTDVTSTRVYYIRLDVTITTIIRHIVLLFYLLMINQLHHLFII